LGGKINDLVEVSVYSTTGVTNILTKTMSGKIKKKPTSEDVG